MEGSQQGKRVVGLSACLYGLDSGIWLGAVQVACTAPSRLCTPSTLRSCCAMVCCCGAVSWHSKHVMAMADALQPCGCLFSLCYTCEQPMAGGECFFCSGSCSPSREAHAEFERHVESATRAADSVLPNVTAPAMFETAQNAQQHTPTHATATPTSGPAPHSCAVAV